MHGHPRAAEHRITAENFRIADDETPGLAQIAERCRELAARLAQIDLEQPALERHDVARSAARASNTLRRSSGAMRSESRCSNDERHERAGVEQPASFLARHGGDGRFVDRVVHRLERKPVRTAASVGVNRVSRPGIILRLMKIIYYWRLKGKCKAPTRQNSTLLQGVKSSFEPSSR